MVCSGGEHAFITRIIVDSVMLKDTFRWYSSMVGRKLNLTILVSELWKIGATVVKTTEYIQGRTSRWGLAWSFCRFQERYRLIKSRRIICLSCWRAFNVSMVPFTCYSLWIPTSPVMVDPVFQQHPGALLVRGKLLERLNSISGMFSLIFHHLEEVLINKFCPGRVLVNRCPVLTPEYEIEN